VLLRAPAVSDVGQMPVPVTVGGVALLAESRVVVQPSRVHLLEAVRPAERLDDDLCAVGADRIANPAVTADDTCEHQVPLRRIAVLLEGLAMLSAPAPPAGRNLAGRYHLHARRDLTARRAQRFREDSDSHAVDYGRRRCRGLSRLPDVNSADVLQVRSGFAE
jgi:hypothetical protein